MKIEVLRMIGVSSNGYIYEHYQLFTNMDQVECSSTPHESLDHLVWVERVTHSTARTMATTHEHYSDAYGNILEQPPDDILGLLHLAIEEFNAKQQPLQIEVPHQPAS